MVEHKTLDEALTNASDQLAQALSAVTQPPKPKAEEFQATITSATMVGLHDGDMITVPLPYKDPTPVAMRSYVDTVKDELVVDQMFADGSAVVHRMPRDSVESHRISPGGGMAVRAYERYSAAHVDHRAMHGELRPGTADNDPNHRVVLNREQQEAALFSYPPKPGEDMTQWKNRALGSYARNLLSLKRQAIKDNFYR